MEIKLEFPAIQIPSDKLTNKPEEILLKLEEILPDKEHIKKLIEMPALDKRANRKTIIGILEDNQLKGYKLNEWEDDNLGYTTFRGFKYFPIEELDKIT